MCSIRRRRCPNSSIWTIGSTLFHSRKRHAQLSTINIFHGSKIRSCDNNVPQCIGPIHRRAFVRTDGFAPTTRAGTGIAFHILCPDIHRAGGGGTVMMEQFSFKFPFQIPNFDAPIPARGQNIGSRGMPMDGGGIPRMRTDTDNDAGGNILIVNNQ